MELKPIQPPSRLRDVCVGPADWDREPAPALLWMLQQMLLIRHFEETLLRLKSQNCINGPVHTSIGQEAVAVGAAMALRPADRITGTHRAHHQYLAKALCAAAPAGFDPLAAGLTPEMHEVVRVLLCEIMGLADGCSRGRGGSMHLCLPEAGIAGTNAIVGGGIPHATGLAWADRCQGRDLVTVCFFGDGALYQGVTHEASNLASLWQAPVVFFIENNHYAVATSADRACSARRLADVAFAYDMPGYRLDGMDPLAVRRGLEQAARSALPCYIEADVYRYYHHAGNLPGSSYGYRDKVEEEAWRERDPVERCAAALRRRGALDEDGLRRLREQAEQAVNRAVDAVTEAGAGGAPAVRAALYPDTAAMAEGLRDDAPLAGPAVEAEDMPVEREIKYSEAIAEVTGRWLEKDPGVVVMGEEVANFGGGPYGATKGLPPRFPERVRNTPISESGFCGLACGAALGGLHPVVEIMFTSFALVAADQLFNQIGQIAHIYGGRVNVPLVVRTRVAIGLGYGAQHSLDPVALFALFPGWRILVPTTPFDYIGLFNAAMRSRSPTVLIEHHEFYDRKGLIPAADLDYVVLPGRAKVRRGGKHVTVAAYGWMVHLGLQAAGELAAEGVDAEVIDLRTVDDAGLDYETLGRSLRKTGMLVTLEQAPRSNSIGAKIARECQNRFFDAFDGAPVSVNAPDVPLPVSRALEQACMPSLAQVKDAIRAAALRKA